MLAQMVKKAAYRALRNNPRIAWENRAKSPGSFPGISPQDSTPKREKLPWFPGTKIGIMAGQETPAMDSHRLCRRRFLLINATEQAGHVVSGK
ncbi:hypothetical protein [Methylomonas methanica]|uniref:hypothetical protein n=1 Tax=Methylomonas methanica TaxID=421 RepID=UPI000A7EB252|nr:hypothetical protein [Methylomonas methanica]